LCNRGNITAETPNETIAFVHDMEKVLLVKLWEVTIPNEAWEKTLVRAHSLITAYHRFGIRLPMLMEFAACIIAKNFPAIESALPAARMELSLALQELVLRMQAQTATPTIGAQEAPGAAPHEVVTSDTANATPKGENEAASARDSEPVANDDVWITFTEAVEMLVRDTDLSAGQARNRLSRHRDHPPIRDNGKTRKARRFDKNTIYAFIQTQNEDECDAEDQRTQEERGFKGYR
jgi:hypothetical protein